MWIESDLASNSEDEFSIQGPFINLDGKPMSTENSEIFKKIKSSRNGEIILSFTDIGKS